MYSVRWAPEALDELVTVWVGAALEDRSLITDATDESDRLLARDPLSAGESREAEFRLLIVLPIAVQSPFGRMSEPRLSLACGVSGVMPDADTLTSGTCRRIL